MDPFQLEEQSPEWPLRLLHVPSMTSYENREDNTYNGEKEPQYNALSYTWGRWMVENGPVLNIHGTTWKIPSIHSDAFSVAQFQTCINLASQGVDFLWLDIACIDQENREIKMSEIGRQAGIFIGAKAVFHWTAKLTVSEIEHNADMFAKLSDRVFEETLQMTVPEASDDFEEEYDISGVESRVLPCFSDSDWIDSVVRVLDFWLRDPWFTSLWTLQEMFLRADATIISAECLTAHRAEGNEIGPANLIMWANTIIAAIDQIPEEDTERFCLKRLQDLTDRLGFNAGSFENPTVLYTATRFRTTIDPLDRIYAIMQVFRFRLGEAAEPGRKFSLEQLEDQLGAAINEKSPVWGQMFVHSSSFQAGRSWRVNSWSRFPRQAQFAEAIPKRACTIQFDENTGFARFRGETASFRSVHEFWQKASEDEEWRLSYPKLKAIQNIMLDEIDQITDLIPQELRRLNTISDERQHAIGTSLLNHYGSEIRILLIGSLQEAGADGSDEMLGVLVTPADGRQRDCWQRIGICMWPAGPGNEPAHHYSDMWVSSEVHLV